MKRSTLSRIPTFGYTLRAFLLLLTVYSPPSAGATTAGGEVSVDTLWQGAVDVTAKVVVLKGATLLIQPGTLVRFAAGQAGVELTVHGTLVAQGTAAEPIIFTSAAEKPQPGDWGGIIFEKAAERPSRISHATIRFARSGIAGTASFLVAKDVEVRDCGRGVAVLPDFRGGLTRGSIVGNQYGVFYNQSSGFSVEDSLISGNADGGIICSNGSSPEIHLSTIVDNGPAGVSCIQGSSPLIEGNIIRGHKSGITMLLQSRPRIFNNVISGNDTGISGEKLVFPTIIGNTIAENGTGIFCNYSAYPKIHGNNIQDNRTFGLVLGDFMSIRMEKKIPFRQMGRFSFERPPEETQLPARTRRFQPFDASDEGIVDARGNWWGAAATQEMARLGADGNISAIEDFRDKPDTWYGQDVYPRDRVVFAPWETEPVKDAVPPAKASTGVQGRIVTGGKPVAGVRVHAYADADAGFRGEGIIYSAPSASDGGFSLDLRAGTWYLVAKGPLPPFPNADPGEGGLFGYYGGNPVTIGAGTRTAVTIQAVARLRDHDLAATAAAAAPGVTGIRGTMRDAAGKVPVGAYAFATTDPSFTAGAMPPHRSQPIGPDGAFFIEIPAGGGTFYVSARSGYGAPPLPGEWHGFHGESKPSPVVVESGKVTEGITIVLRRME